MRELQKLKTNTEYLLELSAEKTLEKKSCIFMWTPILLGLYSSRSEV